MRRRRVALRRMGARERRADAARVERRDYVVDTSTRAMGMALVDARFPRAEVELGPPDWAEHLRLVGVPQDSSAASNVMRSTSGRARGR